MDWKSNFSSLSTTHSTERPSLAIAHLASWGAITLVGDDKKSYLQGQVTCDVVSLAPTVSTLGAHCDAKGKVWSIFRVFHHQDGYALFQPTSAIDVALNEIKKYAVFSKVDIELSSDTAFAIIGSDAEQWINEHFSSEGDVRHNELGSAIKINQDRWLLLVPQDQVEAVLDASNQMTKVHESIWQRFDIETVSPSITPDIQAEHIPQALNLQALNGISFTKGCYTGQETVARAKYRGINKRATYQVRTNSAQISDISTIELQRSVGENWRSAGQLVNQYQFSNGDIIGLVVLPNNLDSDTVLRNAAEPSQIWTIEPLPYALSDDE